MSELIEQINQAFIEPKRPGEKVLISSRKVADLFDKNHFHVIRDIKNLQCSQEFSRSNFGLSAYTTSQGKEMTEYHITRDGFLFLSMGFTGEKAAQWKEALISRFNVLEKYYFDREGRTLAAHNKLNRMTIHHLIEAGQSREQIRKQLVPTRAEIDEDLLSDLKVRFGVNH